MYRHAIQPRNTVTQYSHAIQSRNTVTQYSHAIQPRNTVTQYSHAIQPLNAATQYSHAIQPCNRVTQYSHAIQPRNTVYLCSTCDDSCHVPCNVLATSANRLYVCILVRILLNLVRIPKNYLIIVLHNREVIFQKHIAYY